MEVKVVIVIVMKYHVAFGLSSGSPSFQTGCGYNKVHAFINLIPKFCLVPMTSISVDATEEHIEQSTTTTTATATATAVAAGLLMQDE